MAVERNWTGFEGGVCDFSAAEPLRGAVLGNGTARTGHFFLRHQAHTTPVPNSATNFLRVNTAIGTLMPNGSSARTVSRVFLRLNAHVGTNDCACFGVGTASINQRSYVALDTTGKFGIWTFDGLAPTYGTATLSLGVWYRLDFTYTVTQVSLGNCTVTGSVSVYTEGGVLVETVTKGPTAVAQDAALSATTFVGNGTVSVSSTFDYDFDDWFWESTDGVLAALPATAMRVTGVPATAQGANAQWTGDYRTITDIPRQTLFTDEQAATTNGFTTTFAHASAASLQLGSIVGVVVRGYLKNSAGSGNDALLLNGTEYTVALSVAYPQRVQEGVDYTAYTAGQFDAMEFGARNKRGVAIQMGSCRLEVLHDGSAVGAPPFADGTGPWSQKILQYTGNGTYQTITGVGFGAQAILIKPTNSPTARTGVLRLAKGGGTWSHAWTGLRDTTAVLEVTSDGFILGPSLHANESGVVYQVVCAQDGGGGSGGFHFSCDTIIGDGVDNRNVVMPDTFQPDLVLEANNASQSTLFRTSTMVGDVSFQLSATATEINQIQALNASGFQLGSSGVGNAINQICAYVAWKIGTALLPFVHVGSISPAGASFTVTGIPFTPKWVVAKPRSAGQAYWRGTAHTGTNSSGWPAVFGSATAITSLTIDGFTGGAAISSAGVSVFWGAFTDGALSAGGCIVDLASSAAGAPAAGCAVEL